VLLIALAVVGTLFLGAALWRVISAAARDAYFGNGNVDSFAHLGFQAVGILVMLLAILMIAACSPMHYVDGVPNLEAVEQGSGALILRSGQIETIEGWRHIGELAGGRRVHVLKLNFEAEGSGDAIAEQLGYDVVRIPIDPQGDQDLWDDLKAVWRQPDAFAIARAERILSSAGGRDAWLVHCTHGQDRTGLIIGEYRVLHDGWTKRQALYEMLLHNFHPELHGLWKTWQAFAR
jgi:hypothetical protein